MAEGTFLTTEELDELAAQTAAYMATEHPDYALLAARISVSNLHKKTLDSFSETCKLLNAYKKYATSTTMETCCSIRNFFEFSFDGIWTRFHTHGFGSFLSRGKIGVVSCH